jgi:DNA-binding NarL/FixJ family response regulator
VRQTVLLLEDSPDDAELMTRSLVDHWEVEHVERLSAALTRLEQPGVDVIAMDLGLPDACGLEALKEIRQRHPRAPIVVVTIVDDDRILADAIHLGAQDFVPKSQINDVTLSRALTCAVERQRQLSELEQRVSALEVANDHVQALRRLLAMCCGCKRVRNAGGQWVALEAYLFAAGVSHGMCPDCVGEFYPDAIDLPRKKGGPDSKQR